MKKIAIDEVIELHKMIINTTGGSYELRDFRLLEGALASAYSGFKDIEFYPSTLEKIAKIAVSIIQNHPFVDGNKRIGMMVLLVLLEINGFSITFSDEEIECIGFKIAQGNMQYEELMDLLKQKCNRILSQYPFKSLKKKF